ncbi:MAG: metallopeptidase TldD-related protein [Planctomycetota bacterium]|nr:metallopeptidase TldD-related protein [Planctomycetota bacterium]
MLTTNDARAIAKKVFAACGNKVQAETFIIDHVNALTRYANNSISQNVLQSSVDMSIKVFDENKTAKVSITRFDDASIKEAAGRAIEMLKFQAPDPEAVPFAGAQKYRTMNSWDAATAGVSPEQRADAITKAVAECRSRGLQSFGIFSNSSVAMALENSKGLSAFHQATSFDCSCTASTEDSTGWAGLAGQRVARLVPADLACTAAEKALTCKSPVALDPGRYDVILEPAAVADLLAFMSYQGFGALPFLEGRSFMSGKIGNQLLGKNVTIADDAFHPEANGMPFDFEGIPKQTVSLIDKGVAKSVVYDGRTARKAGTVSTGHGIPESATFGPIAVNLVMSGGDSSLDKMIASTKRGVLVTEFHYSNVIDPLRLLLTGMTRNGTFLVEDGKITKGIKNMRFTESVVEALSRVESLSKDTMFRSGFFGGGFVVPAVKIKDFNFSSETKF